MPKRILIFSLAYHPRVGGAEVAIKEITDRLLDVEFHMLTMRFSRDDKPDEIVGKNVRVHRLGSGASYLSKVLFMLRAARAARDLHRVHHFDAAWVMMSYMLVPLMLSGLKLPYVLTLQEGDTYEHMFKRLRVLPLLPFINRGFQHASMMQVISTYLGTWARQRGFKGPLEIIPNGYITPDGHTDLHWFTVAKGGNRRIFWRNRKINIPDDDIILITTSRLVHKNGLDTVIRTLPLLRNIQFVVLGEGPDLGKLESLAESLQVTDQVHFYGQVKNTVVLHFLHYSDVFVRPSRSEGMGNSFVEAMAAELPVIATQEGGIADFLFDAKRNPDKPTTGWAVDKDTPEQIAAAVKDILGNPEQTKKVIQNARELVIKKYNWDLIARDMRDKVFARLFS